MTLETENADSMSSSEFALRVWGQESAFDQAVWWGWGVVLLGKGAGPAAASLCLVAFLCLW